VWGANTDPERLALTSRGRGALAGLMAVGAEVLRLLVLAIRAIFRPKALPIAENLCLRQRLVVLQRRYPLPRLSDADRRFSILASRGFSDWRHSLLIVKPETVLHVFFVIQALRSIIIPPTRIRGSRRTQHFSPLSRSSSPDRLGAPRVHPCASKAPTVNERGALRQPLRRAVD
jgi:hypothetical protein